MSSDGFAYSNSDYSINFEGQLAAIPEAVIGQGGIPDLTDPMGVYRYIEKKREVLIDSVRQRPLVRLWDKNMDLIGQVANEKSVQISEVMADSGGGNIVIRRNNWLSEIIAHDRRVEEDLHITVDPIPTQQDWRTRWGGKVTQANIKRSAEGTHTVELEMVSNREHLKHLLAGANPFFPPEIQLPKMWVFPWNCRTALSTTGWINLIRQYAPYLSIPTNIFNPGGWVGIGLKGFDPLQFPIQFQFVNPIFDQSRFTIYTSRWDDMHTTTKPHLEDAGCLIRAYTWLTTDKTSPHPELEVGLRDVPLVGDSLGDLADNLGIPTTLADLARPHRNAIIMAVEDKSGTTGPTGTFLDGPLKLATSTADDLITEIVSDVTDLDKDNDGKTDPFFSKLFGTAPDAPWVKFRDGEFSGIIESQKSLHGASAKTIHVGSRSPGWVNQAQTFGIKFALSQIQTVITAGMFGQEGPAPIGSGLEEAYQGQLDDCVKGDTVIDGPDGKERIDVLAERGEPFRVWSITPDGTTVAATAVLAFKKGRAELFEFTLEGGYQISVTKDHKFLTDRGYVPSGELGIGSLVATIDGLRAISAIQPLGFDDYFDMHVPGWENYLAQGIWNHNTLFAWQRYTDIGRAIRMGDFGFLEHREQGAGSAYTVSALADIRAGHWKTRAYTSFKVQIRNGAPYLVNYDFTLGDRLSFEMANILHTDQCTAIEYSWDTDNPVTVKLSIGKDGEEEDPVARATRTIGALWDLTAMAAGNGSIF